MGVIIKDDKVVTMAEPKTIHFEFLVEKSIKN